MTPAAAQRIVLGSLVVVVVVVGLARTLDKGGLPRARSLLAAALVAMALSALSGAAPKLAASFALLIVTASLLSSGAVVLATVGPTIERSTP